MSSIEINGQVYPGNRVIVTKNNEVYENPSMLREIGAGFAGLTVASPISTITKKPFYRMAVAEMKNLYRNGDLYKNAATQAFEQSGLAKKEFNLLMHRNYPQKKSQK